MSEELNNETDAIPATEDSVEPSPEALPPEPKKRSPIQRAGCIIALVIWFAILLIPCFLITLAVQGEIVITTGSAPGQQDRLWLISEATQRGLGLSSASVIPRSDPNQLCVETAVHFLLWVGKSDPILYCDCYQRSSANAEWSQASTISGACSESG